MCFLVWRTDQGSSRARHEARVYYRFFYWLTLIISSRASTCIKEAESRKSVRRTRKARIFINIFL